MEAKGRVMMRQADEYGMRAHVGMASAPQRITRYR